MVFTLKIFSHIKPAGWTVVDATNALVAVAVDTSRMDHGKPRVMKHVMLTGEVTSGQAGLQRLGQQWGEIRFPVIDLLGRNDYQIFLIDKAKVQPEEMVQNLRWTLGTLLEYPAAEANIAWMDVPHKNDPNGLASKMYVVAAKRAVVEQRAAWFDKVRMPLAVVDIRETGQANIAERVETPDTGVCLIFADPTGLQITVSHRGDLYLERFIRESLFEPLPEDHPQSRSDQLDRVALEVQRSLDFVRRNFPGLTVNRLMVGPTQSPIGLLEALSSRMLTPWVTLDLSEVFEWPSNSELVKPEIQALYFNALGASLRSGV